MLVSETDNTQENSENSFPQFYIVNIKLELKLQLNTAAKRYSIVIFKFFRKIWTSKLFWIDNDI